MLKVKVWGLYGFGAMGLRLSTGVGVDRVYP